MGATCFAPAPLPCPVPEEDRRPGRQRQTALQLGSNPAPFDLHETGKHLGNCWPFCLNGPTWSQGVARPCQAQGCLASMSLWGVRLVGLLLSLSCCWAFSCRNTLSSPDFSLPGDYLLAGMFPLHSAPPEVRGRPTVTFCDR